MKKIIRHGIIIMLLSICCVIGTKEKVSAAEFGDFLYEVQEDGTVGITKYIGTDTTVVIPDEIDGKKVTVIKEDAFPMSKGYDKVQLGKYVTTLEMHAFFMCQIKELVLPIDLQVLDGMRYIKGITKIVVPEYTENIVPLIYGKDTLEEFLVDESNTEYSSLDGILFDKKKIKLIKCPQKKGIISYQVPDSVKVIGEGAFENCEVLESILLPKNLLKIEMGAFAECHNLEISELPENVEIIEREVFRNCKKIMEFRIPDKVECLEPSIFFGSGLTKITLGKGMKRLAMFALSFEVQEVVLTGKLEKWDESSFTKVNKLTISSTAGILPEDLMKIQIPVQYEYSCSEEDNIYSVVDGVLFSKDKKTLIAYPHRKEGTDVSIPDGVREIGLLCFSNNEIIENIVLPNSLNKIGKKAFGGAKRLTTVSLNSHDVIIDNNAFIYINTLKTIEGIDKVTSIGNAAFYGCTSFATELDLVNCNNIGEYAFYDCKKIPEVILSKECKKIMNSAFSECDAIEKIEIPDSVIYIGNAAFEGMDSLQEIVFGKGTVSLPFCLTPSETLQKVVIPKEVTEIDNLFIWSGGPTTEYYEVSIYGYNHTAASEYAMINSLNFVAIPWELPEAPDNFSCGFMAFGYAELEWDIANEENVYQYCLYKDGNLIQKLKKDSRRVVVPVSSGKEYDFEISAINGDEVESERIKLYFLAKNYLQNSVRQISNKEFLVETYLDADQDYEIEVEHQIRMSDENKISYIAQKEDGKYSTVLGADKIPQGDYKIATYVKYHGYTFYSGILDSIRVNEESISKFLPVEITTSSQDLIIKDFFVSFRNAPSQTKKVKVLENGRTLQEFVVDEITDDKFSKLVSVKDWQDGLHQIYFELYDGENCVIGYTNSIKVQTKYKKKIDVVIKTEGQDWGYVSGLTEEAYYEGDTIRLKAYPQINADFIGWYSEGKLISKNVDYTCTVENQAIELIAIFKEKPRLKLSLKTDSNILELDGSGEYYPGTAVNISANFKRFDEAYVFDGWYQEDGKLFSKNSYCPVIMEKDLMLVAKCRKIEKPVTPVTPTLSSITANLENGSIYIKGTRLSLTCKESGAVIYYTTDGTIPTKQSLRYDAKKGIVLNKDTKVQAIAYKDGYKESDIFIGNYYIRRPEVYEDFTVGNYNYRVLTFDKRKQTGTVTCMGQRKKSKSAIVPGVVNYLGFSMKVVRVSNYAFKGNGKLQVVKLHKNITVIGKSVFENCSSLQKIYLGDGVKSIGDKAFVRCIKLKSITGTKHLESIGKQAFYYCTSLKKFQIESTKLKKVGKDAFRKINKKAVIKVPKKKYKTYKKLLKNKGQGKKVKIKY